MVAEYLSGRYALPSRDAMTEAIQRDMAAMRKRYVTSKRHTIQVDFEDYLVDLDRERREGGRRAAANGFALPVPRGGQAVAA